MINRVQCSRPQLANWCDLLRVIINSGEDAPPRISGRNDHANFSTACRMHDELHIHTKLYSPDTGSI